MKTFTILYTWMDRHYEATMPGRDAAQALTAAKLQIMAGARILGIVEVTK